MKLIAETKEENKLLLGISALQNDLGVDTTEYRTEEAFGVTFWSASDLCYTYKDQYDHTKEEAVALLEEVELFLSMNMAAAGARYMDRSIRKHLPRLRRGLIKTDSGFS